MRNYKAKDVDTYIASASKQAEPTLKGLRKLVKSTIPKVEEKISWGVPFYRYYGLLAGFAVYKNHASFGLVFALEKSDRKTLEEIGYKTGSKTIQIRFDQKIPTTIIKQILRKRVKINKAKTK